MRLPRSIFSGPKGAAGSLLALDEPASNPGNLRGFYYLPKKLKAGAPLVVVLHGCTQTAGGYDEGSGWSRLAERHGFALLFPEQQRQNNPNLCFNWFAVGDTQRGMGEPASIAAMIVAMRAAHGLDPARTFITGLSAGGAMAAVMLATYPELFAAGAIIAGLPYGCASDVREAFDCMGGRARAQAAELGAKVRAASPHKGAWPRLSVWQGSADQTVAPSNADALILQWSDLHQLPPEPSRTETVDGYPRRVWVDSKDRVLIEHYDITGMAHGTPLMPGSEDGQSGTAGAHMLDVNISSTDRIAHFFGIAPPPPAAKPRAGKAKAKPMALKLPRAPRIAAVDVAQPETIKGVQKTIEDALRTAGLLK